VRVYCSAMRRAVVPVLALVLVVGCGGASSKPSAAATPPRVDSPESAPASSAPPIPDAVAHPLPIGGSATIPEVDPNDHSQQTNTVTLNSASIVNLTDAENVTKPYVMVTVTITCQTGPCNYGTGAFTIHHSDGTRQDGFIGLVADDSARLHSGVLQTGEKVKGILTYDGPKSGTLVYAPHDATLASWTLG